MLAAAKNFLAHPLTRGLSIDDPRMTELRRRIVREKKYLRKIYEEWYGLIASSLPQGPGRVLELGSGAGFFKEFVPNAVTTEIFSCSGIDVVMDGQRMPIGDQALKAVVMTDVMHHLPDVRKFFAETTRCVRSGGVVSMVEPWVSGWSKMIYRRLHHEPFEPGAENWAFPSSGPLSGANGALPWIVFQRDRNAFEREFPQWDIEVIQPIMPLSYLVSGGVSMRSLVPAFSYPLVRRVEAILGGYNGRMAMFAHVLLRKRL
jgi:SAM-dependent methyltransferase